MRIIKLLDLSRKLGFTISNRANHWNSIDEQYWQRSILATQHFQPSLPRLPIPDLHKTCERYSLALIPLLNNQNFISTQHHIDQFRTSGNVLQQMLLELDEKNKHTSYISAPWFDMYLKDRKPLPINYNPALVFLNEGRPGYNTPIIRAANLIISSLRFYKSLRDNILEPEIYHIYPKRSDTPLFKYTCSKIPPSFSWYAAYMFNAYPLDMSQYHNLFNSTRIPKVDRDVISSNYKAKHISVQYKGNIFIFDVLDSNGNIVTPETILRNLKMILDGNSASNNFPLGVLTTLKRNEWANIRSHLETLGNQQNLNLIDSALFNVCFDDSIVEENPQKLCRTFLHGDGKDRWFDKSISLIISKDGAAGINFEHSWGDGVAVLRYFMDIYTDSTKNSKVHPDLIPQVGETTVSKLDFNLDERVKSAIAKATKEYETICNSLDVNVVLLDRLGKNLCKKFGLSPDAIMQLGFQIAYHKLMGGFVGTYESCSTAAFRHGRTETMRPCTIATKILTLAINSKQQPPNSDLQGLISKCSSIHSQLTKEAAMGQGFDRHLFALRVLAEANDIKLPSIFSDSAYEKINYNILSTSTLSSSSVWAGGFGPVVKDGYGIAYSMKEDSLGALVTSYKSHSNGKDFTDALKTAYEDILKILEK